MAASTDSSYFSDSLNENETHHFPGTATPTGSNHLENLPSQGILIGPSDRKRLGDQLRPHVFSRVFNLDSYRCAGLVSKDLSSIGGHDVVNFGEAALEMDQKNHSVVHMGGDSMLTGLVSGYHRAAEGNEETRFTSLVQVAARDEMISYVKRRSGQRSPLAYVVSPEGCFSGSELTFFGVRLPEPSVLEDDQEEHLVHSVGESKFVGVSGKSAEDFFTKRGIQAEQMPCALSVLPRVCGKKLMASMEKSREFNELCFRFGKGWIAVEVGEIPEREEQDFAQAVSSFAAAKGWGIAIYSAKHLGDEPEGFREKWTRSLGQIGEATWFGSSNIWDIAALIGNAHLYVGSCLDSRILASAFCVPRINTPRPDQRNVDYCQSWEAESAPAVLGADPDQWGMDMNRALNIDSSILQEHAESTSNAFFDSLSKACQQTSLRRAPFVGETVDHHAAVVHGKQIAMDWLQTEAGRKRFAKLNENRDFNGSKPSTTSKVKKVVKSLTKGE